MLQKLIINKVINLLSKNFKLFKLMEYVEKPNELDHKVVELESRLLKVEKESRPPIFTTEEKVVLDRSIKRHSDRIIALEKKAKKLI